MARKIYILMVMLFASAGMLRAQAPIVVTPYPAPAEQIIRAFDSTYLYVQVNFTATAGCAGTTVNVKFPTSVSYIPGSVQAITTGSPVTTTGFTIADGNISNLRSPIFNVTAPGAGTLYFRLRRQAGCGGTGTGKDTVVVNGACGSVTENDPDINTYNFRVPALTLTAPTAITGAVLGQTATRTFTVTNGGSGSRVDTLRLYIVYPTGGIVNTNSNRITVSGTDFSPWRTNGDTLFYKVFGPVFPNTNAIGTSSTLDNGETVTISEPIKILKCDITTSYAAYWSKVEWPACQTSSGTSSVTMASGVPNFLTAPVTTRTIFTDMCSPIGYSATFKNDGTGNAIAATMYDVTIRYENYSVSGGVLSGLNAIFSNFNVNSNAVTVSGTNTTIYVVSFKDVFTTDPDGAGIGLDDIDGDGYFDDLAPGKTFTLNWTANVICNLACGADFRMGWSYRMLYNKMCDIGAAQTASIILGITVQIEETGFGSNSYIPANIAPGVPFRFKFATGFVNNTNALFGANGRYQYKLVLPPGVSLAPTPNPKYGTATATYTSSPGPSGDTITIESPSNILDTAGISLVYTCGTGGNISIWHSLVKIQDITTGCRCNSQKYCANVTTFTLCPTLCPAGPTTYIPTVRRTDLSLGWTDATLATRQLASNISSYDLAKALYLDTIQVSSGAKQNNAASNIHLRLELPKTTLSPTGVNKLTPLDVKVEVWRAGILVHSCTVTTAADSSTATMQKIDWDLCLPAGGLLASDSVYSVSRYVVATNAGLPTSDVQSGDSWYYYNKVSTGMDRCNSWVPEMYLVGTFIQIGTNSNSSSGCTSFVPGTGFGYLARRFGSAGVVYQSEFRPMVYIDSIVFTKSTGYDFVSARLTRDATTLAGSTSFTLVPNTVNGNVYTFINPGTWPVLGITKTNAYGGNFQPTVSTNCATTALETFNTKIYIKDYYYAFGNTTSVPLVYQYIFPFSSTTANIAGTTSSSWNYNLNYNTSTKPTLVVQNTTGTVQGVQTNQYWDVKVSNTSTSTAGYVWVALEKGTGTGLINVTSVQDLATSTTLTSEGTYTCTGVTGLKWYKFSTAGIASGAEANFRVNFTYSSCNPDSILFKAGWACGTYPATDPCSYPCAAAQAYLKVIPNPSQVQMALVRQPGNGSSTAMCATDSATVTINSAQAANLVEPYVTIYPPAGVNITTPIPVEYPLNSGTWYDVTPTAIAGGYRVDLTTIPGISTNGLPGTATNPAVNPRQAKLKIAYTTTCDVVSGSSFSFYGFGKMPCGAAALENGTAVQSGGVSITGATASGNAGLTLNLPVTSLDCGQTTTLSLNTTVVGAPTQAGDTVIYTLPAGVGYAGNFVGGTNCSTCTVTTATDAAGNTLVKIKLTTGVAANDVLAYSFDVTPSGAGSCGSVTIGGAAKRMISGLMCGATACTGSAVIVGTGTSAPITINKPAPVLNSYSVVSGYWWPGQTVTVNVSVTNNGTLPMAASSYNVEFFCGTSTTPMAIGLFPTAVPVGATVTGNITFTVSASCPAGALVTAKIRPASALGNQCLCAETSYTYLTPLPVILESFGGTADGNCKVTLSWKSTVEDNFDRYVVEYSQDGINYTSVGTVKPTASKTYSFVYSLQSGRGYYRLKMIDRDGKSSYSDIVTLENGCKANAIVVYPNPVKEVLKVQLTGFVSGAMGRLYNAAGQLVATKQMVNGLNEMATTGYASGVYNLIVTGAEGERKSFKIRIDH